MGQILKGARVNYIGKSKFGGMSMAIKHEDYDGFVQVKDEDISLDGVEKGSIVTVEIADGKKGDKIVKRLKVTGKAEAKSGGGKGGYGGKGGGSGYSEEDKLEFRVKQAQTIALELTKFYVEKEIIKLGAKGKQAEQIEAEFDRLTVKIAKSLDPKAVKALFAAEQEVEDETKDEEPAKNGKKKAAESSDDDGFGDEPEKDDDAEDEESEKGGDDFDDDFDSK